ncbi:MAG: helix-turn-helix transcriptional regulator [Ruminococcus sp.]
MSDKVKNANQRLKILYLYKILLERTDEEHYITMPEIISQLELYGITAARKALYEDIEALKVFGLDIVSGRGVNAGYQVVNRDFELPELKLLADAVSSSRFLTEKKSAELLKKLEQLTSVYEAKQIQRQVFIADRVKAINERIYMNVDAIHRAIAERKKISFKYFDYDLNKKKCYRKGIRTCSPYALTWDDERYYLVAHYEKYDSISNFRVDRMESVEVMDEPAQEYPEGFNLPAYLNSTFSMFSGEAEDVKLRFEKSLINAVIDRFGKNVSISPDGDEHFTVRVQIKTEHPEPFFGWLFQFGTKVKIVEPCELKEKYLEMLKEVFNSINE